MKEVEKLPKRYLWSDESQLGFALPSVLMLVTVLTLVAMSVLLMQHLRYLQAVSDVARVKAEYAAQSGVAFAADEREFREEPMLLWFSDSSSASVRTLPWGLLKLAVVEGTSGRARSTRVALLGASPPPEFKNALCFGGSSRQLIMTGTTNVIGDVQVGPMGAAVGALPGAARPPRLPVTGNVSRNSQVLSSALEQALVEASFAPFVSFLKGSLSSGARGTVVQPSAGSSPGIPDSTESIVWSGGSSFALKMTRQKRPLRVYVAGNLSFAPTAVVEGAVAFYVTGSVQIEAGAMIDNAVIMSGDSIVVGSGVEMRGQLVAARVMTGTNCTFGYPSILCSYGFTRERKQRLELAAGTKCEGLVVFLRSANALQSNPHNMKEVVLVDPEATITGALYAEGPVTLDGTVIGSVMVQDLYFYQAPTSYYGWLRSARIDRQRLPDGFAVPQAFGEGKGEVVVWM